MYNCDNHRICVNEAIQKAKQLCDEGGLRFTELRQKTLEIIWTSHRPAKAYDILDRLKTNDSSAKPPTVYRALDFLIENGLIHKLNSLNAYIGCSHPLESHECYFLICDKCQDVMECCDNRLTGVITDTTNKKQFSPKQITLEISGKCKECNKQK
ncbi:MAG: Fur family transcriptional regulator [Rickettsiales bacterium]